MSPPARPRLPTGQPPRLARPSHGLLARHGWLWLAVPGVTLLVTGTVLSGFAPDPNRSPDSALNTAAGFGLLAATALLILGLPIRAVVVHRARKAGRIAASLSGRYPLAPDTGQVVAYSQHRAHLVGGALLALLGGAVGLAGVSLVIALDVEALRIQVIRHAADRQVVTATLERDTEVYRGRGTRYSDRVDYTIAGHRETGIDLEASDARTAGETRDVLVDPGHPGSPIEVGDHGIGPLIGGGVSTVVLLLLALSWLGKRLGGRRRTARRPAVVSSAPPS